VQCYNTRFEVRARPTRPSTCSSRHGHAITLAPRFSRSNKQPQGRKARVVICTFLCLAFS
jgi:hypothetical protein